jgi:4-hydroxythreonine-4-phosphate dehydrogenase
MPRVGLLLGDRNGIGPEIAARMLSEPETRERALPVVIGDPAALAEGEAVAGVTLSMVTIDRIEDIDTLNAADGPVLLPYTIAAAATTRGEATAAAGREVLDTLAHAARLGAAGALDGIVFAPLNKAAMHLAGIGHEDEMQYLKHVLDCTGEVGELNELDGLWTTRVTSHIPLKDVAGRINETGILRAVHLAQATLSDSGIDRPRIAVCALNPHAGDGGNFGREEIDVIAPAVQKAAADGLAVTGPWPCDTVFVRAQNGEFDAVVTMYHDQGQIAMKLLGFGRGVTVLGGLPMPIATCGHGTAYDIAGQGKAGADSLRNAWRICAGMAGGRRPEPAETPARSSANR